ncbi:hypothetical protein GCM10022222_76650 [Amycolatopsis ultiminotia]|uniref:YCII-related domain-containing protein n=1 Tax=Amycolatopsis ultiminotia TaxID=543629 RepID=A0ABP6YDW3_9PSEU
MPHFALLVYERAPGGFADLPADVLAAHGQVEARITASGGALVAGYATRSDQDTYTLRDRSVAQGPFAPADASLAGLLVVDARDLEHAVHIADYIPTLDGGVEVRPLLG